MELRYITLSLWAIIGTIQPTDIARCYITRTQGGIAAFTSGVSPRPLKELLHSYRKQHKSKKINPIFAEDGNATSDTVDERKRKLLFLRSSTGKGTQECFEALNKANGDVRTALDIIRQGMDNYVAEAGGGDTTEVVDLLHGRVATVMSPKVALILELRCATDFVARNKVFMALAKVFANAAHQVVSSNKDIDKKALGEEMLGLKCIRCSKTPKEAAAFAKMALNEKMIVTRIGTVRAEENEFITSYLHGALVGEYPLNKVGSAAALLKYTVDSLNQTAVPSQTAFQRGISTEHIQSEGTCCLAGSECIYSNETLYVEPSLIQDTDDTLTKNTKTLVKHIVQHIVGARPVALTLEKYDPVKVKAAREELEKEALEAGKPKETVDKIVAGRLRKQFGEYVLMEQKWPFDGGKPSVSAAVDDFCKKNKVKMELTEMMQFSVCDDMLVYTAPPGTEYHQLNLSF
ncbi:translation elongation factor Ts [Babesia ovis]|uniref:Elongation factor Ts, mitochondrial n=1 Tax=Babesia ovis TaxID=5869 RepID=A0A9W5WV94_BABOV|nr:translation elongation factor Ts [Babesia ovis]